MLTLIADRQWWCGPEYLLQEEERWPPVMSSAMEGRHEDEGDRRRSAHDGGVVLASVVNVQGVTQWGETRLDPQRFSSWHALTRVWAWVTRFRDNCRRPIALRFFSPLSPDEIGDVEITIIWCAQREVYHDEMAALKAGKPVKPSSPFSPLMPRLDEYGLMRGSSRLQLAEQLPWAVKHPVVLPRSHAVT